MQIVTRLERMLMAPDPLRALRELNALRAELDAFERDQVRRALESGASFAAVARALGITRQAAHRRYRHVLNETAAPRLAASPEALALLHRARQEAAHSGASTVNAEHVALAVTTPRTGPPSARPPATLERRLYAALARIEGPIGVDELLSAVSEDPRARALLDRGNRERLASVRGH